jgi:uncharacterized protein (TIGR00255 family)
MLKSMTGYGRVELIERALQITAEIKSLNARYLDINCRLPKAVQFKELEIRDIVKQFLVRGSVTVSLNLVYENVKDKLVFNEKSAAACLGEIKKLNLKLKLKGEVTLDHLLKYSDFFFEKEESSLSENEWKSVRKAIIDALRSLDKMRQNEGHSILKDLQNRIKKLSDIVDKVESVANGRVAAEKERIRERIAQLFENDEIDEQRLQMEIVLMANKLDVAEEITRLRSHIKFFYELMKAKEPVGNKMTFLLQEMNREINTIGSKSDDADISQSVVSAKEEIERIREQAANIE